jgi:RNA polymerase sigma-70 factor (ECF subfamily)
VGSGTLTDAVVAAAGRRDPDALRAVWVELSPVVLGYLRSKGVSDPEAVTSDVFVALIPRIDRVQGGVTGLRKLTFTIAHARMVDEHRARARAPEVVEYEPADDPRTAGSAEDAAADGLALAEIQAVLAGLPDDQAEVIRLRVVADLSLEQVAEIMGRSTGAIKQLQRRGLLALRAILAARARVTR